MIDHGDAGRGAAGARARKRSFAAGARCRRSWRTLAEIAPILRGACAIAGQARAASRQRFMLDFRTSAAILDYVNGAELARYSQPGVVTPDHIDPHQELAADRAARRRRASSSDFAARRRGGGGASSRPTIMPISRANNARAGGSEEASSIRCRAWCWCRASACSALGRTRQGCRHRRRHRREHDRASITDAEAIGRYERCPRPTCSTSNTGRWSRPSSARRGEQAAGAARWRWSPAAAAASARRRRRRSRRDGAEVAVLDRDGAAAAAAPRRSAALRPRLRRHRSRPVRARLRRRSRERFGGVDIVVSNAGAAWQGRIGEVDDAMLRQSFELNFFAHQTRGAERRAHHAGAGHRRLRCCSTPPSRRSIRAPDFGPYGLPKAATLFLMRQYALDYGARRHPRQRASTPTASAPAC